MILFGIGYLFLTDVPSSLHLPTQVSSRSESDQVNLGITFLSIKISGLCEDWGDKKTGMNLSVRNTCGTIILAARKLCGVFESARFGVRLLGL